MKKQLIVLSGLMVTISSQCGFSDLLNQAKAAVSKAANSGAAVIKQQAAKAAAELKQQGATLASGVKAQSKEFLTQAVGKATEQTGALMGQASQHVSGAMEAGSARVSAAMEKASGKVTSKIGGKNYTPAAGEQMQNIPFEGGNDYYEGTDYAEASTESQLPSRTSSGAPATNNINAQKEALMLKLKGGQ